MIRASIRHILFLATLFAVTASHAQWTTQNVTLKPGWNAVYLHLDASHASLADSIGTDASNPIAEIWLWNPSMFQDRFIAAPQQPVAGNDWSTWNRTNTINSTLARLVGNAAYLVRNTAAVDYVWSIKGKPLPPHYNWTTKGNNFIGFPTPASNPPLFANFLNPVPHLVSTGEFYIYDDGNNNLTPTLFNAQFNSVRVTRGQAYWIRNTNEFNRYFGAFEVVLQNSSGIHFGASGSQYSVRLRNLTPVSITVTQSLVLSEAAPPGQPPVSGSPPLLLRGALNPVNLTYGFTNFSNAQSLTLQPAGRPGSETEIVLGVNRVAMTGNSSDLYAGVLRLTDSLGYSQIDLPVTASPASTSGLWIGNAVVSQVRQYLKNYQRNTGQQPVLAQVQQSIAGSDTAGLLLEMRLDEGTGPIAKNSAPGTTSRYGLLTNSPDWRSAQDGPPIESARPSLAFSAAKQQFIDLSSGIVLGTNFTEEAWIYPTSSDSGGSSDAGIIGFQSLTETSPSLSLLPGLNTVRFAYTAADGTRLESSTGVLSLLETNWNHVAATFDGATLKIYVNGIVQLNDATTFAGKPPKPLPVKWVGRSGNSFFQGRIAQVRLWNVARTAAQIQQGMSRPFLTPALGQYVVLNTNTNLGSVARPFNLRLIVHQSTNETRLLQRVYFGSGLATNVVLTTRESLLHPDLLGSARRISASHLPFSDANEGWPFTGQFSLGQSLTSKVNLAHDDYASNPYLHGFHPDHDNLNATFDAVQPRGVESYGVERTMTLTFSEPGSDFASIVSGGNQMTGQYSEEITFKSLGEESRRIDTAGSFILKRISEIDTLTTQ